MVVLYMAPERSRMRARRDSTPKGLDFSGSGLMAGFQGICGRIWASRHRHLARLRLQPVAEAVQPRMRPARRRATYW